MTIDNTDAPNTISADLFTVEAGELDFAGDYNGAMIIGADGVLSPGNSIGTLSVTGNVTVDNGGKVLFEFGSFDSGEYDKLFVLGADNAFTAGESSIELSFLNGDQEDWATLFNDGGIQLISGNNLNIDNISLTDDFGGLFALSGNGGDLYLVAGAPGPGPGPGPEPGSGVPEPSTWALLLLGAAGLMYWRKKNA